MGSGIRFRLLSAFALVVFMALGALLISWVSITQTQERINAVMTETLPLLTHASILDKEAALFAASINELPSISTNEERTNLVALLDKRISIIELQLTALANLGFKPKTINSLQNRVDLLVKNMDFQHKQVLDFISVKNQLQKTTSALFLKHNTFTTTTNPRINEGFKLFLQRGDEISSELLDVLALLGSNKTVSGQEIKELDNKLRIGLKTLISSAAGEMRANLEMTALTNLSAGLLNEAANSTDKRHIEKLQTTFESIIPKVKRISLLLAHSTPENNLVLTTAMPIFRFGSGDDSIFSLRLKELSIRHSAAESAKEALVLSHELTTEINDLLISSQDIANQKSVHLQSSLKQARVLQVVAGLIALFFSILIGFGYVEKKVISRLSALKESMQQHASGNTTAIPLSGNDEISAMAFALQGFVTQRQSVERKLRRTLDELNAVMDNIDYGIVFMDAELKASIVNKAFKSMWGITDEDFRSRPSFRDLINLNRYNNVYDVDQKDFDHYLDKHEEIVRKGDFGPVEIRTKTGLTLQYQVISLPENGRMVTYFDITELKDTQNKLLQSQKMEAIGLMAGGVAHDLNNILSGIVSYPDLMLMQLPDKSELRKPIQTIKDSGIRAAEIVADLLTVARGAASTKEVTDLNELITEYLYSPEGQNLKPLYPGVEIRTDLEPAPHNVSCSSVHIKKCLMNLVINAAEAIQESGIITISTHNRYIEHSEGGKPHLLEGEYAVLSVKDNGPGISDNDIERIFEPFHTKKEMGRSGTGLGLTIVWNTMKEHDGAVTVTSSESGTSFELYLPVSKEYTKSPSQSSQKEDLTGNNQRILVVDDEPLQRDIACQILQSLGYQVETASSGEEAIERTEHTKFDLILLDMIMNPGLNGRRTYEKINCRNPGQKAIIASGFTGDEEVKKVQELGAGDFIKKPYTYEEIGRALKKALCDTHPTQKSSR